MQGRGTRLFTLAFVDGSVTLGALKKHTHNHGSTTKSCLAAAMVKRVREKKTQTISVYGKKKTSGCTAVQSDGFAVGKEDTASHD